MATRITKLGHPLLPTCRDLAVSRGTVYRHRLPKPFGPPRRRPSPKNRLSRQERGAILEALHSEPFLDLTPQEIVPRLADQGRYLGSIRTFYRVLWENREVKERRLQARRVPHAAPVLEAKAPNEVWSWDITHLKGPYQGKFYYLYLMLDLYSRYIVGWMVAERQSAQLAQHFIRTTVQKHLVPGKKVVVHSDRGSPMTAITTVELLTLLGLSQSLSRPRTSDDNPFSEAQFRAVKYHSWFPPFFSSKEQVIASMDQLLTWCNCEHMHTGLNLLTPEMVHFGKAPQVVRQRQAVMDVAYANNRERFSKGRPLVKSNPEVVGINLHLKAANVKIEAAEQVETKESECTHTSDFLH